MADNIQVTQGSGTAMATDEIGGVHYARVKLAFGADGSAADVSSASPLPVSMSGGEGQATEETLLAVKDRIEDFATVEVSGSKLLRVKIAAGGTGAAEDITTDNPLPVEVVGGDAGLATEATLSDIDGKLAALATEATLSSIDGNLAGLATEATLSSIDGKFSGLATEATLSSLAGSIPSVPTIESRVAVDAFPAPGVARQLSAGAASGNTALTSSARRISIRAVGANIRYAIGTGAQTASATSHYIAQGERLTLGVPASAQIAVIRAESTDGTLELTELS